MKRDDSGASLIFALIIVTVFSIVVTVVLTFADTSLRVTVALRDQAAEAASADGAAKLAINALRRGTFAGTGSCFDSVNTLTLTDFYQPPVGGPDSAAVTCEADTAHSGSSTVDISPASKPRNAILTLAGAGEDGLNVAVADGRSLKVHGPVFSNSTVTVTAGNLTSDRSITARGACSGSITGSPSTCNIGTDPDSSGDDPDYPPPTADTTVRTAPFCPTDNMILTFTPGQYNNLTALNNLVRCRNTTFHFPPGTYYFNFAGAWTIDSASLVAGTPTRPLVAGTPPTIPGSCVSPVPPRTGAGSWTPPAPSAGVQFVFGSGARLLLRSSQAEICGIYSATAPPIAIYGLKTAVGTVPAEDGCTILAPYPASGCAVIKTEFSANSRFYVQGTTYLPRAAVEIALNNPANAMFSSGVIARTLRVAPSVGAALTEPVVEVPDDLPRGRRTVVYLNVYLCAGASSCAPGSGTLRLRAKVGLLDPSGTAVAGARQVTVYTWSVR